MEPAIPPIYFLPVKHHDTNTLVPLERIIYLKGSDKDTKLFANPFTAAEECRIYLGSHNLGHYMYLQRMGFIRVHQSYMVNLHYLDEISEEGVKLHCQWKHEPIFVGCTYKKRLLEYSRKPDEDEDEDNDDDKA